MDFFDNNLWDRKVSETGFHYNGLMLEEYFDYSILSVDYLNIYDYFISCGGFDYDENRFLSKQYADLKEEDRLKLIENVLNIVSLSSYSKESSSQIMKKALKYLYRHDITVEVCERGVVHIKDDEIIDSGSYCDIKRVADGIVKKELKSIYRDDEKLIKRMKYEYDNMIKLIDCPNILNVYEYLEDENAYLMEKADKNLIRYLEDEVDINLDNRIKIIKDVLNGMKYAHEKSIIHRDLHLGNILKMGSLFVISDFGLSKDESITRSLKSSFTPKNNHIFVDPIGLSDFNRLDYKSDIYSIGKLIEYILNDSTKDFTSLYRFIVEKCTHRDKSKRYKSIDEIIFDLELKINENYAEITEKEISEKIKDSIYDAEVSEYIQVLLNSNNLCNYIVKNNLNNFGKLIVEFELLEQKNILNEIEIKYAESTGYMGFENYDIYADISYYVYRKSSETLIKNIAISILEGCASYRYKASNYLNKIEKEML